MGVPFDNLTCAEAITIIEQMIASRRPHYLVTPNVDFLVQAGRDVELRRILFEAHLVVCDGTPLVWASRLLGNPLPERVAGADLVPRLIAQAAQKGYRLFFLGAAPESIEKAIERLRSQYPALQIVGYYSPPFAELLEMDHEPIKQRILATQPDLLFVAFGCPKQEKWIAMHYRDLGVPFTAGVGGTIDFLGGTLKRAPRWMQRTGTEWMFRLAQEPRRLFRRYARDLWSFGWSILPQWWRLKAGPAWTRRSPIRPIIPLEQASAPLPSAPPQTTPAPAKIGPSVRLPERLDLLAARQLGPWTTMIRETSQHWFIDSSTVQFLDSTGVGLLIQWKKLAQSRGCEMVLIAPSDAVQKALSLLRLQDFFLRAPDLEQARLVIDRRMLGQTVRTKQAMPEGVAGIEWQGEITAANADKVWKDTRSFLERHPQAHRWEVDLSHVVFMDSSGLGLLVRLKKSARACEAELHFTGLQPAVRNILRLAHLEEFLLDCYASGCRHGVR